jgi:hypothetical protein
MCRYNDCGACDDDEIGCQKCSIDFVLWPYRPVHVIPPLPGNARCWGVMAEIRLMRPPVNGLEQTFRERCLSATPNSRPTRREAAGGPRDNFTELISREL